MEGLLLVDGYNVLNAWPELARLASEDLEHARERLISCLSEFHALSGLNILVVFDAHNVKGGVEREEEKGGIKVVYTKEGETADQWIERFAARYRTNPQREAVPLFVTTFDWLEQRIVAAQGAYRITPAELRSELLRLKEEEKKFHRPVFERNYLDNYLTDRIRKIFEVWRRQS
ncbi:MAG: NYN domain-containing protein [Thermacetogeniaceae bacterium]